MTRNNTNLNWLEFYIKKYKSVKSANSKNLYTLFNEVSMDLLKLNGILSFIIPEGFLKTRSYEDCVEVLQNGGKITKAVYFEDWVFEDATTGSMIFEFVKSQNLKTEFLEYFFKKTKEVILIENAKNIVIEKYDKLKFPLLSDIALTFKGMAVKDRKDFIFSESDSNNEDLFLLGNCIDKYFIKNKFYTNYEKLTIVGGTKNKDKYQVIPRILTRRTGDYLCCVLLENVAYTESTLYSTSVLSKDINIKYLLSVLNSKLLSYIVKQKMITNEQAFPQILMTDLQLLKIPKITLESQKPFIGKADQMLSLNKTLQEISAKFQRTCERKFENLNLNKKLQDWYNLSYADFIKELSKQKIKLSLSEEAEWADYFDQEKSKALEIQSKIASTDKEIDQMVYELYGLSEEEILIVENS